jgi:uncharacterized protein
MTSPEWPHRQLDVEAIRAEGWRPVPFREFILKVHQRCNLSCDYCYVYEGPDQSWRDRPISMAPLVWRAAAGRIAEHVRQHQLDRVHVVLHGGEPLLAGPDRLQELTRDLREAIPQQCEVRFEVQTNGVLLTQAMAELLLEGGVRVGVSLDGTGNDRHRRFSSGRGSLPYVRRGLAFLAEPRYRPIFAGLLCVVDPGVDPLECYDELLRYEPPSIDFLLPHANWAAPPERPETSATPYADWLRTVFDRWFDAPRQETRIRFFESIVDLVLGSASRSEQVGLSPAALVVIESDGAIEQVDSLKSAYAGAADTGLNVLSDSLDTALWHPGVVARQIGVRALGDTCQRCPEQSVCGGGHYAHRYAPTTGFLNPTVYCADMLMLVQHVRRRVAAGLSALVSQAIP